MAIPAPVRRPATLLATAALALSPLLLPQAAQAATGAAAAQTTDQAGDGRVYSGSLALSRNLATADILAAGVRVDATTVTFFTRLAAAPSAADLASSRLRYTVDLSIAPASGSGAPVVVHNDVYAYETQASFLGAGTTGDYGYALAGSAVTDPATGQVTVTYDRQQLEDGVLAAAGSGSAVSLTSGARLRITGATSSVDPGDLLGARTDSAAAGPVTAFAG
jgi:hypothetical protein